MRWMSLRRELKRRKEKGTGTSRSRLIRRRRHHRWPSSL